MQYVVVQASEGCSEEFVGVAESLEEARELAAHPGPSTPAHLYATARAAGSNVPGCAAPPDWYRPNAQVDEWIGDYAIVSRAACITARYDSE